MVKQVPYLFTKADVRPQFLSDMQYENWIAGLLRTKKIMKVRKGLYVLADVTGEPMATKFEIASKIADDAFLCYHSALEFYGAANQVFHTVTVGSKSRFNPFTFLDVDYIRKQPNNDYGIAYIEQAGVRITTLERTVIDCIDDVDACGGIDELLGALGQIRILDEKELLGALNAYNCVLLYQKAGYILQHYQEKFGFSDDFFDECKRHLTKQVKYFLKDEYGEVEYNSEWRLMAPKNLIARIGGGY